MNKRKDFPILNNRQLVYLDSAATSQKPQAVIDAMSYWYKTSNANTHRGAYQLAEAATAAFEATRRKVAEFINAETAKNIVFTKGTTEAINLVAQAWAKNNLKKGDTILLTEMEHHANIVPWQMLAQEKNLILKWWPIDATGRLRQATPNIFAGVKLLALTHVSNVLGVINPIGKIIKAAHARRVPVLIDAAQSAPHLPLNIKKIHPDWLVFSSHKMLGPTGIGVLYTNTRRYTEMSPYQGGGEMIETVGWKKSTFKSAPWKFEAGTQPLAEVIGLGAAIDYLNHIGLKNIAAAEKQLIEYAYKKLHAITEVTILGPRTNRCGLISFTVNGIHPHDLATWLDRYQIAIRAGHHCAQPLHNKLNIPASARISLYIYNNKVDIDRFIVALKKIIESWQNSTKK